MRVSLARRRSADAKKSPSSAITKPPTATTALLPNRLIKLDAITTDSDWPRNKNEENSDTAKQRV